MENDKNNIKTIDNLDDTEWQEKYLEIEYTWELENGIYDPPKTYNIGRKE